MRSRANTTAGRRPGRPRHRCCRGRGIVIPRGCAGGMISAFRTSGASRRPSRVAQDDAHVLAVHVPARQHGSADEILDTEWEEWEPAPVDPDRVALQIARRPCSPMDCRKGAEPHDTLGTVIWTRVRPVEWWEHLLQNQTACVSSRRFLSTGSGGGQRALSHGEKKPRFRFTRSRAMT